MSVIKPPLSGNIETDNWTEQATKAIEELEATTASVNISNWTISEDADQKLLISHNNILKFRLASNGNLEIAGTLTQSTIF
jgi:hypothetical protein